MRRLSGLRNVANTAVSVIPTLASPRKEYTYLPLIAIEPRSRVVRSASTPSSVARYGMRIVSPGPRRGTANVDSDVPAKVSRNARDA
jgi:hypothetical protein